MCYTWLCAALEPRCVCVPLALCNFRTHVCVFHRALCNFRMQVCVFYLALCSFRTQVRVCVFHLQLLNPGVCSLVFRCVCSTWLCAALEPRCVCVFHLALCNFWTQVCVHLSSGVCVCVPLGFVQLLSPGVCVPLAFWWCSRNKVYGSTWPCGGWSRTLMCVFNFFCAACIHSNLDLCGRRVFNWLCACIY